MTTTGDIIATFNPMFGRCGKPKVFRTDNKPHFASRELAVFLEEWGVTQSTSSPYYPQSNGEDDRTVRTAKHLLRKSTDNHKALLAQHATPEIEGQAPAELLMGRRLRTSVPENPESLQPRWDTTDFRSRNA